MILNLLATAEFQGYRSVIISKLHSENPLGTNFVVSGGEGGRYPLEAQLL
jgi:hypothetical protein